MDYDDLEDLKLRKTETKAERRARRKAEMERILAQEDMFKEQIQTQGAFVMSRIRVRKNPIEQKETELLQLLGRVKMRGYTDEEIGAQFRRLFGL